MTDHRFLARLPRESSHDGPALHPSRRALLAGVGAGIATGLAGCSGTETNQSSPEDGTLVTDYAAAIARLSTDRPPITHGPTDGDEDGDDAASTPNPVSNRVLESEDDASELVYAEDATNVDAIRRLVTETTYDSESVFVYQRPIGECYELQVNYVTRDADGDPSVQLCRVIRDAEVDCERDVRDHVAVAVRLPFPADEYGGFSIGSGESCDPVPERYRNESDSA
ncbi:hypothetical protein SY89_00081 [Halolamina pelagica]|uniref:Uncharacterized protein n=1 Tax=Halolamina pelagica TaxID=699431 RepID=A0A0P7GLF3_9EURY|nr:hypothetical protein [Halolamina pelagica]KPN29368.1 hypothetical protein SY89_00081 [Halolamina pelagica]